MLHWIPILLLLLCARLKGAERYTCASTHQHSVTNVWQRPLHQVMSPLTTGHQLSSTVKISSKPYKYLCPLIVKRQHEWRHNALCWSYFSKEMHSNCHDVFVAMTTEFSKQAKQDLAPSVCSDKSSMILIERGNNVHNKCAPAAICMLMLTCSYLNITRTQVFEAERHTSVLPLRIGYIADVKMWIWTWLDDLRPFLDIVPKEQEPHRILWPYKDVDAYEESRCEELQAITFTFHRPMCAWVQVQNIVLTRSQRFIVLLLSDVSWWGNLERIIIHMNTLTHINKQIISPLPHFSPSLTCCSWCSGL